MENYEHSSRNREEHGLVDKAVGATCNTDSVVAVELGFQQRAIAKENDQRQAKQIEIATRKLTEWKRARTNAKCGEELLELKPT